MRCCFLMSSFVSAYLPLFIIILRLQFSWILAFSTTDSSSRASSSIDANLQSCWEEELWKIAKPLSPAPPSLAKSMEILKRDGVVRLNPNTFRVDESLCAALRDRILAEIDNQHPGEENTDDSFVDKYVPGTRLRPGEKAIDLAFAGDARHDILLPLNDKKFSQLRPVLASAARQLEPLLLVAAEQLLPRLHGSNLGGTGDTSCKNFEEKKIAADSTSLQLREQVLEKTLSAEVVEVSSLVVRQGSGHQGIHGDYRRFAEGDDDIQNEEPLSSTRARDGKMPPRIVTFVALQDIPTDEHGSTGFITGTHNSRAHRLMYNEPNAIENDCEESKARRDILQSSTNGVRTSRGFRRGEMLIYDASVLHWGGANSIPKNNRAILYFGISRLHAAAQLSRSQPKLKFSKSVAPILLQDIIAHDSVERGNI